MTISNVFYSIVKKNNDKELNTIYVRACVLGLFIVFFVGCSYKSPYKDMVEAVEKGTVKDVKYFFKKLERENKEGHFLFLKIRQFVSLRLNILMTSVNMILTITENVAMFFLLLIIQIILLCGIIMSRMMPIVATI